MLKYIKSKHSKVKVCQYEGCTELYIARNSANKYCKKHRGVRTTNIKQAAVSKPLSSATKKDISFYARMLSYEEARLKAINSSPDINSLLVFSPDNGKTLIYCKDEEQLNRAKKTFKDIFKR